MKVGEVTQTVEVAATAVSLNTENATVGSVIENERIVELPLDGRNFLQLTALDANVMYGYSPDVGAATSRMGGQRVQMDISVAGGRPEFDYYTLDGISNTDVALTLTPSCRPLTPSRSSRSRPASSRRNSAAGPPKSTFPRSPAPTTSTGPSSNSCATLLRTRKPIASTTRRRTSALREPSCTRISLEVWWGGRCISPTCSMAGTSSSSCSITKASGQASKRPNRVL